MSSVNSKEALEDKIKKENPKSISQRFRSPQAIKAELDQYIIGQEEPKELLSVAVYHHYQRTFMQSNINSDIELTKGNVLLTGPTGSGKTYLVETLAKILGVPFVSVDATDYSETGYAGLDVTTMVQKLVDKTEGNLFEAENGIIYIDEIDKIADTKTDINGKTQPSIQKSLLKLLEGKDVNVKVKNEENNSYFGRPTPPFIDETLSTSNILFIGGGAFEDIYKEKRKTSEIKRMGFTNESRIQNRQFPEIKITSQDLIDYGFSSEFTGRWPIISNLTSLSKEEIVDVLLHSKNSILKQYETFFWLNGIQLEFDEKVIDYIAEETLKRKVGVRGIRGVLEDKIYKLMFNLYGQSIQDNKYVVTMNYLQQGA